MILCKLTPLVLAALLLRPRGASSAPSSDRISVLPGFGTPPTPHYSGYLDATPGCDTSTNGPHCFLHYWFASAEGSDASSKPVVLWLNGGPGSSSILGFLQENGPLLMNATGGLMDNPYAWTKVANLLALETPVGVGYSYCAAQSEGKVCQNTDKYTASAARAALVDFFTAKFPELAKNDFFITGESYAGVYIPTLSKEILDNAAGAVNLKGIAVGDPCTDNTAQSNSMDYVWYGHKYGFVPEQEFDLLWNKCNVRMPNLMARGGPHVVASKIRSLAEEELSASWSSLDLSDPKVRARIRGLYHSHFLNPGPDFRYEVRECKLAHRKFLLQTSKGFTQGWHDHFYINNYDLFGPGGLTSEDDDMTKWMMNDDVKKALHVEQTPTDKWPHPSAGFHYSKEYDACNWSKVPDGAPSMIDFYREIAPKLDVTLVYNGDTDPCVSYEGTRTAMARVGFPELDGGSYRPWFYNHAAASVEVVVEKAFEFGPDLLTVSTGPQYGGSIVNYDHGLSFLTVHGSGHMVPQFRPQAALHMVRKLVGRKDFTPLMPSNATLADMGEEEFEKVLDEWTDRAKGPPYVEVGGEMDVRAGPAANIRGVGEAVA